MIYRRHLLQAAPLALAPRAWAEEPWPPRGVRIVVPNPPGGTSDIAARLIFAHAAAETHKPFVIENRAGGNSGIGMVNVARAAPDGLSFVLPSDTATYLPLVQENPPYTIAGDFTPVSLVVAQPLVIVANTQAGIDSIDALVKAAKARPGSLGFGTSGAAGTTHHVAAARFAEAAGFSFIHVPYKGGGQAVTDLVANQIPIGVLGAGPVVPYAKAGRLKILAVTSRERSPSLPDIPTLGECGVPGIDITQWFALYAPVRTPAAAVNRMAARVRAALAQPDIRAQLSAVGIDALGTDGAALEQRQKTDAAAWLSAVRRLKISV